MRDNDRKKDYEEFYKFAHQHWMPYMTEAKRDLEFALNIQWDSAQKAYLKRLGREALVFNKGRRVQKLVGGYQRKNRLALKVEPIEGSSQTASQLSKGVMWTMQHSNAYHVMSDAFEWGAVVEGMNLVEPFITKKNDFIDGDLALKRLPYSKFLLDPNFTQRDLSDCNAILTRDWLMPSSCISLLPSSVHSDIKRIKPKGRDEKFSDSTLCMGYNNKERLAYDQFWVRESKQVIIIADPNTMEMKVWQGKEDDRLKAFLASFPQLKVFKRPIETVHLNVLIEGNLIWHGQDPYKTGDYPYIPILGFFCPEAEQSSEKVMGLWRCMRDPQTEINKRRSQFIDMIESQINTGWKAKEGAVSNEESLFQSGQGENIFVTEDHELTDVDKIRPTDIPQGFLAFGMELDKDLEQIPGANAELFGSPENDDVQVAGLLAKLRSANGLTVLQDLFDNYRLSKKLLGNRVIRVVQMFSPQKVTRIIDQQPTQEFYDRDFGKYDALPVEGVLTDSQRGQQFAQLMAFKQFGIPIPTKFIINSSNLEDKEELLAAIQQQEQQQAKQAQQMNQLQQLQAMLANSQAAVNVANANAKNAKAVEDIEDARLDRAKAIKEMWGLDLDQLQQAIMIYKMLTQDQQVPQQQGGQQQAGQPQAGNVPPVSGRMQ
jgi:hypothetical protein